MICVLADENIAGLDEYFAYHDNIRLIKSAGRQLADVIQKYQPDALLIRSVTPINACSLADSPSVRFVGTATLGIDHVDTAYLYKHGIAFACAAGSSKHSVAQYVLTAITSLCPQLIAPTSTLGIIGLGHIGSTLARYAADLGLQVAGYDPFLPPSLINNSNLPTVLQSDIVSIHTPLTKAGAYPTYHLINKDTLKIIPKNSLLINAARGEIIDGQALLEDMTDNHRRVVLDVFDGEPVIPKVLLDRLSLATPHIAGYTLDAKLRGTDMVYQALCHAFDLPVLGSLAQMLPPNPYHWQTIKAAWQQGKAMQFYDIKADDSNLRQACDDVQVTGERFDALRKHYPLKREWVF